MRIISGKWKSHKLSPPVVSTTRPTTDRTKEALFGWLEARYDFSDAYILDLFAGFGGVGLEFLSRGAGQLTWVEQNKKCVSFLQNITQKLAIQYQTQIYATSVSQYLSQNTDVFDIVFVDPPYEYEFKEKLLEIILSQPVLRKGGLLIFEHRVHYNFPQHPNLIEVRNYGEASISFFEKSSE